MDVICLSAMDPINVEVTRFSNPFFAVCLSFHYVTSPSVKLNFTPVLFPPFVQTSMEMSFPSLATCFFKKLFQQEERLSGLSDELGEEDDLGRWYYF